MDEVTKRPSVETDCLSHRRPPEGTCDLEYSLRVRCEAGFLMRGLDLSPVLLEVHQHHAGKKSPLTKMARAWRPFSGFEILVLGGPVTTVLWVYQRRATGVTPRETNNLLAEIILDFL